MVLLSQVTSCLTKIIDLSALRPLAIISHVFIVLGASVSTLSREIKDLR
jgi:hypothetical protein